MSKISNTSVTTKNKKGFVFASDGLETSGDELAVKVNVEIPESFEEAVSADFYGSETAAMDALAQDWQRRCVNAARPLLREAETELDWESVAQQAVDTYKPGRRGGFTPKVSADEINEIDDVETLRQLLRSRGLVKSE